jgi:hypothetical protein
VNRNLLITPIILSIFISLITNLLAQAPDTAWTRHFHRGSWEPVYSIQETSDEGFIMVGPSHLLNDNSSEAFLVKTDRNGDSLWSRVIGNNQHFYPNCVKEDPNGGYVIVGEKQNLSGPSEAFVVKTDENGDSLWSFFYGASGNTLANYVTCTADTGYVVTGHQYVSTHQDIFACKLDAQGASVWLKIYDRPGHESAACINQTMDEGFLIGGKADYHTAGRYDFFVVKTDSVGDTLWTRTYGRSDDDYCYSCQQTSDSGFIFFGTTDTIIVSSYTHSLAIKTDTSGQVEWQQIYYRGTGGDFGHSVQQTSDGGYIFGGNSLNPGQSQDFCFMRTDADGNIQWIKTVGGAATEFAYSVLQTADGGYVLGGETSFIGSHGGDFWIVKLNAFPSSIEKKDLNMSTFQLFQNYPNPFNPVTTIEFFLPHADQVSLKIFNLLGEEVATLLSDKLLSGHYYSEWDARNYPSGIYYYKFQAGNYREVKKMILLK